MNIIINLTSIEELTQYIVEFNELCKNKEQKDKTNLTITIVHIIVGSKMMQMSEYTTHNHEYTTFFTNII